MGQRTQHRCAPLRWVARCILAVALLFAMHTAAWAEPAPSGPSFEISFPASVHAQPITGRMLLMVSRVNDPEVRLQVGWLNSPPVFGVDVNQLKPGQAAVVDSGAISFPLRSLTEIPPGDYYVQALLNVYTEFHRADGHVIWAHMDQWEGQQFNQSPGNLYSKVQKLHLDGAGHYKIKLSLSEVIPPVQVPADTEWVKHIKIQSDLLTKFWGHPFYLGAVVLLPRGYSSHPDVQYPAIYQQGHFSQDAPFAFSTENIPEKEDLRGLRESLGYETGYQFQQAWSAEHFPRMIAVTFLHPTPFYDDSYAVNSANVGPYGDAIMTELIPYLEKQFRIIREPYARVLTGGSTGGWESLALQLFHPDFFGGTWTLYPDPIDFRRYGLVNAYDDDNAFVAQAAPGPEGSLQRLLHSDWAFSERPVFRASDGQELGTMRELSRLEEVLGTKGRSGQQIAIWEAVYGPVGDDGYPKPLWDKVTGKIDHSVAAYMRDHGYDLRYYAETQWPKIGPQLEGKLHLYCGDMDSFYLNMGVYLFEDFLKGTKNPYYQGSVEYGRPLKGHGWQPTTNAELVKTMADYITKLAPQNAGLTWADN
jgi:hypothetical protein